MARILLGLGMALFTYYIASAQSDVVQARLGLVQSGAIAMRESAATGNLAYLHWASPLALPGDNHQQRVAAFLAAYGSAFLIKHPVQSFVLGSEQADLAGGHHLKYHQYHAGVPVFDGHLAFHFDAQHRLKSLSGVVVSDISEGPLPTYIPEAAARYQAQTWMQREYADVAPEALRVAATLYWFREGLAQGLAGQTKLVYYVELTNQKHLRDYLFIDAVTGQVVEHFPGICTLAERHLYQGSTSNPIWREGMPTDALTSWQKTQLHTSEETYAFFENNFNRRSFDDHEGEMHLIDKATFLNCPNASWNGFSTNYCDNISTDDVVAHEWAHAYTEYTNNLIYAWQAGAINEALSDIWGETIDLLNDAAPGEALRTDCGNSNRWKIAEDATALGGAIRDMWTPHCHQHPASTSDTLYFCSNSDYGGVHKNSGVVNYAYALLVDGGNHKDETIVGIGLTKAAHIFWHAQNHYLSRTSDFPVLADALEAAFADLRGVPLPPLRIGDADPAAGSEMLTAADSLALSQVLNATELRNKPEACTAFGPALRPDAPVICAHADYVFHPFFAENFEQDAQVWQRTAHPVHADSWVQRSWEPKAQLPRGRAGTAMFAATPALGHCDTLKNNGVLRLESPTIQVPSQIADRIYLQFDHYFALEKNRDGGNLKIQRNGGTWRTIPTFALIHNPYNTLLASSGLMDNPLDGQRVFTGADVGSVAGSWGTTLVDLTAASVQAGDAIALRWELGTDACNGWEGWYVDDIAVGSCMERALLPVAWLDFAAVHQGASVRLHWATEREYQNTGFDIERSTDGRTFQSIGWVKAAGTTAGQQTYTFEDAAWPRSSTHLYYRLRQVDTDGAASYSPIRSVAVADDGAVLVFPNPVEDVLTVQWPASAPSPTTITLVDVYGRPVLAIAAPQPTATTATLPLKGLPAGLYFLTLTTDGVSKRVQRVLKN